MTVAVVYNDDADLVSAANPSDVAAWKGVESQARAVHESLGRCGFDATLVKTGASIVDLTGKLAALRPDLVFNSCESFAGDADLEAPMASLLELLRLPYTGSRPLTLALARDKALTKELLRARGLGVARSAVLRTPADRLPPGLTPPLFVKTRYEDASHGISERSLCPTALAAEAQAADLMRVWQQDCLVEEFLPGREFYLGVVFDGDVLPPVEMTYRLPPSLPRIVTCEAKWVVGSVYDLGTVAQCPAENLDPALADRLRDIALSAYRALDCRDYARVDVRLDAAGEPCVLEVNPNPDISPDAGLARAAACAGISYDALIGGIAQAALGRARGRF